MIMVMITAETIAITMTITMVVQDRDGDCDNDGDDKFIQVSNVFSWCRKPLSSHKKVTNVPIRTLQIPSVLHEARLPNDELRCYGSFGAVSLQIVDHTQRGSGVALPIREPVREEHQSRKGAVIFTVESVKGAFLQEQQQTRRRRSGRGRGRRRWWGWKRWGRRTRKKIGE